MFRNYFKIVVIFTCLFGIGSAKQNAIVCQRELGDLLLSSQPLIQVSLLNQPKIHKSFEGYKITCLTLVNVPLGLEKLVSLSILEGGIGCDFVGLQINVAKLLNVGVGLKIFGVKANLSDLDDLVCNKISNIDVSDNGGLLGGILS